MAGSGSAVAVAQVLRVEAFARARALRSEALALRGEARQRRRDVHVRSVTRDARLVERELRQLGREIESWNGVGPPVEHLTERLETVEVALTEIEAELGALRQDMTD